MSEDGGRLLDAFALDGALDEIFIWFGLTMFLLTSSRTNFDPTDPQPIIPTMNVGSFSPFFDGFLLCMFFLNRCATSHQNKH